MFVVSTLELLLKFVGRLETCPISSLNTQIIEYIVCKVGFIFIRCHYNDDDIASEMTVLRRVNTCV